MNRLKELRVEKNMYQKDIGKLLNMSQTGYSQYEIETNDIPTDILKKLSLFYNTSIDYILCITDLLEKYSTSAIENELNQKNINRLREIREDRDLTQKDIAKIIGMSQTGYSKYEVGTNDIPTDILKQLSMYYDVSIDYLLYMTDERKPYPKSKIYK